MDFWHGFAVITVVHLLAAASHGPDFAYVTRQSLVQGRRAGLLASAGIALGLSIHIVYSAAGLAAVIAHSTHWMTAIKLLGGAYLLYLGFMGLRSRANGRVEQAPAHVTPASPLRQVVGGFLCNALNPKAPIYFVALFTVVLSPSLPIPTLIAYAPGSCYCSGCGSRWSRCCSRTTPSATACTARVTGSIASLALPWWRWAARAGHRPE